MPHSTLAVSGLASVAAKTMVTTTISAAFGAVTAVILAKFNSHIWSPGAATNGLLAGLVGVTAGCSTCEPEGAMVIGIVSGFVYTYASKALVMFKVRRGIGEGKEGTRRPAGKIFEFCCPRIPRGFDGFVRL